MWEHFDGNHKRNEQSYEHKHIHSWLSQFLHQIHLCARMLMSVNMGHMISYFYHNLHSTTFRCVIHCVIEWLINIQIYTQLTVNFGYDDDEITYIIIKSNESYDFFFTCKYSLR